MSADDTPDRDSTQDDGPKWQRRKQDRPAEIITAALAEFARNGFEATRLEDVASRAGVSKGTIYRYFDHKQALFEAALRARISPIISEAEQRIKAWQGPAPDLLATMITALHSQLVNSDYPKLMRILIAEGPRFPHLLQFYHQEVISKALPLLQVVLDRGVAEGSFRKGPASRTPLAIAAPGLAAILWQITFQPYQPQSPDDLLQAHLDLVLNGLKA